MHSILNRENLLLEARIQQSFEQAPWESCFVAVHRDSCGWKLLFIPNQDHLAWIQLQRYQHIKLDRLAGFVYNQIVKFVTKVVKFVAAGHVEGAAHDYGFWQDGVIGIPPVFCISQPIINFNVIKVCFILFPDFEQLTVNSKVQKMLFDGVWALVFPWVDTDEFLCHINLIQSNVTTIHWIVTD